MFAAAMLAEQSSGLVFDEDTRGAMPRLRMLDEAKGHQLVEEGTRSVNAFWKGTHLAVTVRVAEPSWIGTAIG